MVGPHYKVYVVVDRDFGERLNTLETGVPVWMVDTPTNKTAAQRRWQELPEPNHLTGVTTFSDIDSASSIELLLAEIDTIDLHHGTYSADPPYTILEVIGSRLTGEIKEALAVYGFDEFKESETGFCATRQKLASGTHRY
jgi:hypothetical protein